jgi:hypothetical protein
MPRHHAMLFSYFDDSSDKRREHYFACGGLLGHENQWLTFDLRWLDATHELKKPFRSTHCEGGHGQFHDDKPKWPKTKREALMDSLVAIIGDYRFGGFASIVPVADYRAVFPGCKPFDPYYLAVRHTLINMAVIADRIGDSMEVWFEDSSGTSVSSLAIYQQLRAVKQWKPASRLTSNIHFGSKSLCPLQAADLVAREAFKHMGTIGTGTPRKAVADLSQRLCFIVWNRETLSYLRDHGGPDDFNLLTSWIQWKERGRPKPPNLVQYWKNFGAVSK